MSNFENYNNILAFHPGYYIADIIEEMGITQEEFAIRLGTTPKTISKLVSGQINLSNDLSLKLSIMFGNSIEFWLNLQTSYEEKILEIKKQKDHDAQATVALMIDYSFFQRVAGLPATRNTAEKISNLCQYLKIADLRTLARRDFLANFRTGVSSVDEKNIINAQAWLQTALNVANEIYTEPYNQEKLQSYLPEIRNMTLQKPSEFLPRLQQIFAECGVAFVLLPHLKCSGVNGAVKWTAYDRVVLAMNDRRMYADTFWFSLFHEIKHVLQQKVKTVFLSANQDELKLVDARLEADANEFAQNYLIPSKAYRAFSPNKYTSDAQITAFAESIHIHPGIVAGRMQNDEIISQSRCSSLKEKYVFFS